jgi:MFS family permease
MNALQDLVSAFARAVRWLWRRLRGRVVTTVGGTARTRVVVLFAGVLALSSAQISTIGAVAPQLESSLHLDNTQIGLLNSVTLIVAAVTVIPVGLVVDRVKRVPVLSVSIILWSIATILGAIAPSYGTLLLSRVALGAVSAVAGPAIASLTGDYFPSSERGHVYGYILTGEILGTAVGFVVCGNISGLVGWRPAFWVLAIPGFFLARELWRTVPEPARGGYSRLERGVRSLQDVRHRDPTEQQGPAQRRPDAVHAMAENAGYRPDPKLILRSDPDRMSLGAAVRYIISIPTNLLLIVSSSLGYFFFAGLETFATVFVRSHFHVSQGEATLVLGVLVVGAVIGTLAVGPVSDFITRRGHLGARVWVPAVCDVGAGLLLIPGFLTHSLTTAIPFCFLGTALIAAANPPLDAARLDIMPSGLWGRAESTRTFLRSIAQAVAPLAFGAVSDLIAGFTPHGAIVGTHTGQIASGTGTGLQVTFLIMLVSLFASGWFLWRARPSYPRDVATAGEGWTPGARGAGGGATATWEASADSATTTVAEGPTVVRRADGEAPTVVRRADDEAPTSVSNTGDDDEPLVRPR